ncbi:MAG: toxin ParE1/3/4 [Pseudomonadota bacterium]|nr:toxin ParE1/3/4 [Pseudomonadota bacterium]
MLNLDQELTYIAQTDPAVARLIMQRIHQSTSQLINNPALGHPGRVHGTRELVVPDTRYIIPYRVRPRTDTIEILRVFHTSRKPPKNW